MAQQTTTMTPTGAEQEQAIKRNSYEDRGADQEKADSIGLTLEQYYRMIGA